jgi:hypothetical protein
MSTQTLPRLLDRKSLAAELGVKLATAENLMRKLPKVTIGRRVYVSETAVRDYLKNAESVA